jgi:hypothetical protein
MEFIELFNNIEAILGFVIAVSGAVFAASKKLRRKLRAGAKAVKDTE